MKHMKRAFTLGVFAAALLACLQTAALGQTNDGNIANMSGGGSGVRWDILVSHAGGTLTITFPDGRAIRKSFRAGAAPDISLGERQLENLPDGVYSYELTLSPVLSAAQREALAKARGNDDDPENERMLRKRPVPTLNKSGSFAILNGSFVIPGAVEGQSTGKTGAVPQTPRQAPTRASANTVTRLRNHRFSLGMPFDFVIADDTIIQGSACVGLDCVNGEVFGFDTIRLKENNTRIQFDDTSAAGFPTNNWQIRANSSAAGGASFLAFVDQGSTGNSETGTIVFEVDAGAPANSLKVSSSGKVGIRTATPVLDVHVNASDTPAFRMEQNSSGGFTAQTWDIGANEANWFVRDVTGGSRLPLRIRPGAPTSSVDISAAGNVGIGNTSPTDKLEVKDGSVATYHANSSVGAGFLIDFFTDTTGSNKNTIGNIGVVQSAASVRSGDFVVNLSSAGAPTEKLRLNKDGNLGIGTNAPDQKLSVQHLVGCLL